jgi:methylamine dehydrogenase accessory protein MauD
MVSAGEELRMNAWWLASYLALWLVVLFLGFLLLGALRAQGLLRWRLEQLEATTPSRIGRGGLKPGKKAPDFTLPSVSGGEGSLHDFAGRRVLLVFTQSGCQPCHRVVPELNKLQRGGEVQVLVVNNGELEATRQWAGEAGVCFPMLVQQQFSVSKRYEMFATPFAFLIDERGVITSKGVINNGKHIGFLLSGAAGSANNGQAESEPTEVGVA